MLSLVGVFMGLSVDCMEEAALQEVLLLVVWDMVWCILATMLLVGGVDAYEVSLLLVVGRFVTC